MEEPRTKRTLTLPESLDKQLRLEAASKRISVGKIVEEAVAAHFQRVPQEKEEPQILKGIAS
ncbi:hypothetical protein [Microcoleus sp. FACHB-672]|jgi:predicted HicB family RNase H-like nuclease|uniref:hypothetical protein n=1 Tax=Microcoleus sp. FACHB-672 TaxID=2692825 RepID=UPI001687B818|nr:hypothetical protein [Microcoleus sp. FACHB-672]MBD2039215.1 hypothetical protein [Microcoleus sp. FACHB-672]MBW4680644.1 hypothetical protein [Microcoleus vaginatus WJT46-NPBG5]